MTRILKSIEPHAALKLQERGALLVDVREPGEHAQTRIPGARNVALSRFTGSDLALGPGQAVVFFCASGNRTNVYAAELAAKAGAADAYVMRGGLSAWGRAGLAVETARDGGAPSRGMFARMFGR